MATTKSTDTTEAEFTLTVKNWTAESLLLLLRRSGANKVKFSGQIVIEGARSDLERIADHYVGDLFD